MQATDVEIPTFDPTQKKKRKKKKPTTSAENGSAPEATPENLPEGAQTEEAGKPDAAAAPPREDYTYEQLLGRVFEMIGKGKPTTKGTKIPPPTAYRVGTSRTLWANFPQICKALNRNPQHFLTFVTVELGTTANLDGNGRLVIRGWFMPKQLESVMSSYIQQYVVCKTCKSRDTILKKENRLYFVECQSPMCGSTRSVPPLNKGYVHQIKRKKGI